MQKEPKNISVQRTTRHALRDSLTCVAEALVWVGCIYAATLTQGIKADTTYLHFWLSSYGWGLAFLAVVTHFIPNNTYSRTARRDEVVACAMKTALFFVILAFAASTERDSLRIYSCLFFFGALTVERLILNSWFIRYSLRHSEHGILVCNEETAWQQQALQQNTYGLKLNRLEKQTAQSLTGHLDAHPETTSVYCAPTSLPPAELETIAHTCRTKGLELHLLPHPIPSLNVQMQGECRGTVCVLSPTRLPLQSILNRTAKRLTDIVLSLLVLLTVFPVFTLIAFICIKRQSRGPILTARHLCGMNGKTFLCLTFRTRHYEAAPSFLEGADDPGYFPFGKFLRNSKLELLPQFLCVLWGSMTIVGSQTIRPELYADYRRELQQLFASNHRLKAGITSYQPVSLGKASTQADVWYYRNWGFWLDLRIMLQRLGTLLSKSRAKSINYI